MPLVADPLLPVPIDAALIARAAVRTLGTVEGAAGLPVAGHVRASIRRPEAGGAAIRPAQGHEIVCLKSHEVSDPMPANVLEMK